MRQDLASVPRDSDLSKRYLDTLSSQEEQLTQLTASIAAAQDAAQAARDALRGYVQGLKI